MTTQPLSVIILAAGQGKRMHSALPKVLHPLAGKPLLSHVLKTARQLKPAQLLVVHGHGAEAVRGTFPEPDIHWVHQDPPQGTGDAVRHALLVAKQPLEGVALVLYGDVPLLQRSTLEALVGLASAGDVALLTQELANPTGYGRILRSPEGQILGIVEEKDATQDERAIREINTGMLAAPLAALGHWVSRLNNQNAQGEYYLTDVVGLAVQDGIRVQSCQPTLHWEAQGINDKGQLAQLERAWQRHLADQLLQEGVTLSDPTRIDIRGSLKTGPEVSIDVGCVFEGAVELGKGVTIGPNVVIKNSVIGAYTEIRAMSHIDGAHIGANAVIGPFARLRPGASIGQAGHIGNFVEVKNARLGEDSKANHLAYIGDAEVGARVNIGAGVITCNFDGANKHQTIIEDDVFIGSDAQLVAPVRVGEGATIGAGTTLTSDAPAQQLTVSRAPQRSIPGWKRPQKK